MYKMLTQKYPIKAEKHNFQAWYKAHQELIPPKLPSYLNLPTELDNMIMKCLAKSPAQRPQNIGEILRIITPLEREYNQDKSSNSIKVNLGFQATNFPSLVDIYRQSSWPADKPQQKIVFPSLTEAQGGKYTSLWTMLDREEVEVFTSEQTFCFNHFLFQSDPHPLVLWVNLLYNRNYKPKWLPCYLDLKTSLGQQIMRNLVSQKVYHLLLFAREKPQKYQELITVKINQDKVKQLQSFLEKSLAMRGKKQPEVSKIALKKQFELVKQTILDIIHRNQS